MRWIGGRPTRTHATHRALTVSCPTLLPSLTLQVDYFPAWLPSPHGGRSPGLPTVKLLPLCCGHRHLQPRGTGGRELRLGPAPLCFLLGVGSLCFLNELLLSISTLRGTQRTPLCR